MQLRSVNPTSDLCCRRASDRIQVGLHPTIFGMRIRAGWKGSPVCEIDWCAGDNHSLAKILYNTAVSILESRIEDDNPFQGLPPCSKIKPANLDTEFIDYLAKITPKELTNFEVKTHTEVREISRKLRYENPG